MNLDGIMLIVKQAALFATIALPTKRPNLSDTLANHGSMCYNEAV